MLFNLLRKKNNPVPESVADSDMNIAGALAGDPGFDSLHRKEKEEFLALLENSCDSLPPDGEQILDLFITTEGHVTPEYLREKMAAQHLDIPVSTIAEVLELLCRYGIAQKIMLNGTGPWYEHLHLGNRHDHLVCTKCGKVVEFEDDGLNSHINRVAGERQFLPLVHKLNIAGICPACQEGKEQIMPLALAGPGERVRVVGFDGGQKLRDRLTAMGLSVGETVEVINSSGPYIVNVRNSRIALGKGLAQKVMVSPD